MAIWGNRQLKSAGATQPGELILWGHGARQLGLVLQKEADWIQVGVLKPVEEPHPHCVSIGPRAPCVSYGCDWIIEPVEDDTVTLGNVQDARRAGLLVLTAQTWMMNFAVGPVMHGRFHSEWRDLNGLATVNALPNDHAAFAKWSVWRNAGDRADPRAEPLWRFEAKVPDRA